MDEAGVDPVMMERFRFLCDAADKRGMKLIVGLVSLLRLVKEDCLRSKKGKTKWGLKVAGTNDRV